MTEKIDIAKLLEEGHKARISPEGYSMYPLIIPGRDHVELEPFVKQRDKLHRGDILLYRRDTGLLVLHRVHRIDPQGRLYFCGDNQSDLEGPIMQRQVLGKVSRINRKGREFSTHNVRYKFYSGFWIISRPLRPLMHTVAQGLRNLAGFFKRFIKKQ